MWSSKKCKIKKWHLKNGNLANLKFFRKFSNCKSWRSRKSCFIILLVVKMWRLAYFWILNEKSHGNKKDVHDGRIYRILTCCEQKKDEKANGLLVHLESMPPNPVYFQFLIGNSNPGLIFLFSPVNIWEPVTFTETIWD